MQTERPTGVRYWVLAAAFLSAVLLYLDRFCMNYAQRYVKEDLGLTDDQLGWCMSAFFLSYAAAQVPSGWLTDRYGARAMLSLYILVWSAFTAAMGAVGGFMGLLLVRLLAGVGQAGAYPTCASVVRNWMPISGRGMANSTIAVGGRVGGAIAPILTASLVIAFVPRTTSSELVEADLLRPVHFAGQLVAAVREVETPLEGTVAEELVARRRLASVVTMKLSRSTRDLIDQVVFEFRGDVDEDLGPGPFAAKPQRSLTEARKLKVEPSVAALQQSLLNELNSLLEGPSLVDGGSFSALPLEREGKRLLEKEGELEPNERMRLNRLVLEATFPDSVRKIYVRGWRPVMFVYGSLGIIVAAIFWYVVRNKPAVHPSVNDAERELIERDQPVAPAGSEQAKFPLGKILTSRSLWLLSISQFGTNIGWAFLVTWLPRYLFEVHQVPFEQRGWMASVPLWVGWFGMLGGGFATDRLASRLGIRWGRALPMGLSRAVAAAAFLGMLWHPSAWTATILFAVVAFATDFGAGSVWAFNQDVGGRYTASVLGWGNMWGNIGAAVSPLLLNDLVAQTSNWDGAFLACAIAFIISGLCGICVDARRSIAD